MIRIIAVSYTNLDVYKRQGRTYVYQAMRVTGAADPTVSVKDTLKGKLPQDVYKRQGCIAVGRRCYM